MTNLNQNVIKLISFSSVGADTKITLTTKSDAFYIRQTDTRIHDSEAVKPGVILDYDDKNNLVGIENPPGIGMDTFSQPEIGTDRVRVKIRAQVTQLRLIDR